MARYFITATAGMKKVQQYVFYVSSVGGKDIDSFVKEQIKSGLWIFAEDASQAAEVLQAKMDALSKQCHRQRYIIVNVDIDIRGKPDRRGRKCVIPRRKAYLYRGYIEWMVHHEEGKNSFGNIDVSEKEAVRLQKLGLKIK